MKKGLTQPLAPLPYADIKFMLVAHAIDLRHTRRMEVRAADSPNLVSVSRYAINEFTLHGAKTPRNYKRW